MTSLDHLLTNPQAHGPVPAAKEVAAWEEEIYKQWLLQQTASQSQRQRLFALLFWGSVTAGAIMLASALWNNLDQPLLRLQQLQIFWRQAIQHPYWLAAFGALVAALCTRPLRELLLDEVA